MNRLTLTFILLCALALGLVPASAAASSRQVAIFEDNALLAQSGATTRDATLDEVKRLGVDVIKLQVPWDQVAGLSRTRPAGFDGRDPAEYPGWGPFDAAVAAAKARGFDVLLAIGPPAPGWATKKRGDATGVDRPSAKYYGRYAEAAAKRFPNADMWTLWNEPNHKDFLYPQSTRRGVPYAPRLYRSLVRAGVAGLRRGGTRARILFGEMLPIAPKRRSPNTNLKPVLFLREFFCLDSRGRRLRGRAAARHGCKGYKRLTGLGGLAHHPYTRTGGPRLREPSRDDAGIRSVSRLFRVLDTARRRGRIGGRRLSLWNTEFGYQSDPPDRGGFGTKVSRIPGFINEAEWMSYRNRRIASYSQYTMVDDPLGQDADRFGSWQGGLRFVDRRPKGNVYTAFRLPIFVRQLGPGAVEVWGATRPSGAGGVARIQQRAGKGGWKDLGNPISVRSSRGYFKVRYRIRKAGRRTYRFQSEGFTSRATRAAIRF